jgi:hypothetical protein
MGSLDDGRLVTDRPQAPLWVYPQAPGSNPKNSPGGNASRRFFWCRRKKPRRERSRRGSQTRGQTKTKIRITSAKSIAIFSSAFMPPFRVAEQDSNRDHAEE